MINIVQIQAALLVPVNANFISEKLGFKPARTDKRAMFWNASEYPKMCDALVRWIEHQKRMDPTKLTGERPKSAEPEVKAGNGAAPEQAQPFVGQVSNPFGAAADPFGAAPDPFAAAPAAPDLSNLFG
jgi:hypothetical protein